MVQMPPKNVEAKMVIELKQFGASDLNLPINILQRLMEEMQGKVAHKYRLIHNVPDSVFDVPSNGNKQVPKKNSLRPRR